MIYLEDISVAMNRIIEYIAGYHFSKFKKDYKTVDAIIRNFEIIGEASKFAGEIQRKISRSTLGLNVFVAK